MRTIYLFCGSLALLALALFAWSTQAPGFSYDEAWLGLFAHRISTDPGFWPVFSMSSYTLALCQYLTAVGFKLFGTHVATYRAVGNFEILLGVSLLSAAIKTIGHPRAAALFPAVIAFFPAMVMNHRWSVELTTFSVLCTGLAALGLAQRWKQGPSRSSYALILSGIVLGVTSHMALFAAAFALWYCLFTTNHFPLKKDKAVASFCFLAIGLFLTHSFQTQGFRPEVGLLTCLTFVLALVTWWAPSSSPRVRAFALAIPASLGAILIIPLLVYLEGEWLAKQFTGSAPEPIWFMGIAFPLGYLAFRLWKKEGRSQRIPIPTLAFLPLVLLGTYALAPKVGARYLQIPFLWVAAAVSIALGNVSSRDRIGISLALGLLSTGGLWNNYLKPSIEGQHITTRFRLGKLMKDSSEDFKAKFPIIKTLSQAGCAFDDLAPQSKWMELEFMAIGDWPKLPLTAEPRCQLKTPIEI